MANINCKNTNCRHHTSNNQCAKQNNLVGLWTQCPMFQPNLQWYIKYYMQSKEYDKRTVEAKMRGSQKDEILRKLNAGNEKVYFEKTVSKYYKTYELDPVQTCYEKIYPKYAPNVFNRYNPLYGLKRAYTTIWMTWLFPNLADMELMTPHDINDTIMMIDQIPYASNAMPKDFIEIDGWIQDNIIRNHITDLINQDKFFPTDAEFIWLAENATPSFESCIVWDDGTTYHLDPKNYLSKQIDDLAAQYQYNNTDKIKEMLKTQKPAFLIDRTDVRMPFLRQTELLTNKQKDRIDQILRAANLSFFADAVLRR